MVDVHNSSYPQLDDETLIQMHSSDQERRKRVEDYAVLHYRGMQSWRKCVQKYHFKSTINPQQEPFL